MFGNMINRISSFIQFGNNYQNNTIIYNAKIDTSVKRLEKDFHDGNFKQAMEDLSSLMDDNKDDKRTRYQLLVKKASLYFSLRRYDEAIKLVENIATNYTDLINISFDEIKLIQLSLEKNEKDFFLLVDKIIAESTKTLDRKKFELMYYLNSRDLNNAKMIFESLDEEIQKSKEYALIGGHIYSSFNDYENADFFYQIALSQDISFLDKSIIISFYGTDIINKFMYGIKLNDTYNQALLEYKQTVQTIIDQEEFFDNKYIENFKNNYLFILRVLDEKDEYIKFYSQVSDTESVFVHHYFDWCNLTQTPIDHMLVQENILKNESELLLYYCSLLELGNDDSKKVISFLEDNEKYIFENQYIFLFYIQAKVFFNEPISKKFKDFLVSKKYENIEYLLAYLTIIDKSIYSTEDIRKLIESATNESQIIKRIFDSLDVLMKNGYRREYIDLALTQQEKFPKVIAKTLELCYVDKNLHITDFEYFEQNINTDEIHIVGTIANIYANFNAYDKSFENFYMIFEKGNQDKEILFKIIEMAFRYYKKTNEILEEKKEREIYDILIAKKNELALRDLIFLFQYSLVVLKDTRQILPILNEHLLNTDIETIDKDIKIELSNLYMQTTIGMHSNYEQLFIYEDNICYVEDGKTYLKGYAVAEENKKNFGFYVVDKNTFFTLKNNPQYKQDSLFHRIVGPFAYRVDNPNMIPIQVSLDGENPLSEFYAFMDEISQQEKDLFERYTQEEFYGLYPLSKRDYADYFTLIPYLLEHEDYSLNSLKPSFMIDKKKILTLSSIIFLNHLGYLEEVLKMESIVIQQTTINWLQQYIEGYTPIDRPTNFSYMDDKNPKFIPYTEEEEKKAIKFKDELTELTKKLLLCEIIDDTNENLPIAGVYEMLATKMGVQEYHALAYCVNHNYQIISENNVFEMLFDTLGYNKTFISNSFALLANILKEEEIYTLKENLFVLKYKYIDNCPNIERVLTGLNYDRFKNILNEQLLLNFRIWYEYGCMDDLIKEYIHKYKVLYPKTILPEKDIFSDNMEYLLSTVQEK